LRHKLQIFGHRGSVASHTENTIAGFLHAMECGADGVELDVAVTLDDRLAVTHDLVLGDGRVVREHRADELALPTLDEVLALRTREDFWWDVEAKSEPGSPPAPREFAGLLSEAIRGAPRVVVRSFDHEILRELHDLEPLLPLACLIEYDSDDWVGIVRGVGASIISPHFSTVTAERVLRAHEGGIQVSVWTVNDPGDLARMAEMGVDTVITDRPCQD